MRSSFDFRGWGVPRIAVGITILLSLLGSSAAAAPIVSVVPSSSSVKVGDIMTVNISVNPDSLEVYGASFDLVYDSSILSATEIVAGTFLTQDGASSLIPVKKCNNSNSECEYAETRMGIQNGVTTPGILATITFKAIGLGTSPLNLVNLESTGLVDLNASSIDIIVINGTVTVHGLIPPTPTFSPYTQGNFWINQTWQAGTGNRTDSYYVKLNGIWTNGTTATFRNITVVPHGWSNISVWAYNNSGELSITAASRNIQLANNPPVISDIPEKSISEGQTLTFTVTSTDADSDPLTKTTNATKGSFNAATGQFTWKPTYSDSEVFFWTFTVTDGYGGTATETVKISVNTVSPTTTTSTGGAGGGGAGVSGEDSKNIEKHEQKDGVVSLGKLSSFDFSNAGPITTVSFTGKKNFGDITVKVEILKSTSTLINEPAPGTIYQNFNLWVGTSSFAKSESIENPVIKFRVENAWLSSNGFDPSDVALLIWDTDSWKSLETNKVGSDETFTSFESKTEHFSSFAISAQKNPTGVKTTSEVKVTTSSAAANGTPSGVPVKETPGFGVLLAGSMILISCIITGKRWIK